MARTSPHRQGIDLARFLASFGVVVAHAIVSPQDWVGHLSLAVFLVLTAFLAVQSAQRAGGSYAYLPRARRLVLPWLAWSAFYRVLDLAISDDPDRFRLLTDPWSLLYGSYIHLWFLPFVGLAMILVGPAVRHVTTPARLITAALFLCALSTPLFWLHELPGLPEPLPQWAVALPGYMLGLLLGIAHALGRPWVPLLASLAMTAIAWVVSGGAPWSVSIVVGLAGVEFFWRLPLKGAWLPKLGQVAFGIYLIHPFCMLAVYKFVGPRSESVAGATVVFLISWVLVVVLRRLPIFARVT